MKNALLLITLLFSNVLWAQKAVLLEDGTATESSKTESKRGSFVSEKKSLPQVFQGQFESFFDLRAKKRVGIGFSAAGQLGMLGALAELNFALDDSAVVGFGGGPKYSTLAFEWKHVFGGKVLSPYTTLGFAHWYGSGSVGAVYETTPNVLAQKFLNESERSTGKFGKDLFIPSAGLQYNLLKGPYVGASIFAEVMLLVEANNLTNAATGSTGLLYYF